MYTRLQELKDYQKTNNIGKMTLAHKIGIDFLTLCRVLEGKSIYNNTSMMIDVFLDSPKKNDEVINKFLEYSTGKAVLRLSREMNIPFKTIYNIIGNPETTSKLMKKRIKIFLEKEKLL